MKTIRMVWVVVAGLTVLFGNVGDASAQETVTYYHTDAIGSVRMVTDANGQAIARYDYLPFGEPWGQQPVPAEVVQFAGKERDPETGLNYFGARYYAGRNGRFTSVDPVLNIGQAMVDPQRWNRYIYALNRPLSMIDPDGREAGYLYLGNGRMADPYHGQYVFTNEGGAAFAGGIILIGPAAAAAESIGLFAIGRAAFTSVAGWALGNPQKATELGLEIAETFDDGVGSANVRQAYLHSVTALGGRANGLRRTGASAETIARALHAERRALGVRFKSLTSPGELEKIYARNLRLYGDRLGPSIDWLRSHGKSWDDIIESASRPGGSDLEF